MEDIRDYSLLAHNTFGIDARCQRFIEYASVEEACRVARILRESDLPFFVVGKGSNLLLTHNYDGIVVHSAIRGSNIVEITEMPYNDIYVRYGSGVVWDDVVAESVAKGWHGAENLSLIPGEVGASAVQNIGAYGVEAKDLIFEVEAVDIATGEVVVIDSDDCGYSYRQSRFKHEWKDKFLITHVTYRFSRLFLPLTTATSVRPLLQKA